MGDAKSIIQNGALEKLATEAKGIEHFPKELRNRLREILRARRSESTIKTYYSVWSAFVVWCQTMGYAYYPATSQTVAGYLAEMNAKGYKKSTIQKAISVIRLLHTDKDDPTRSALVREVWKGIKKRDRRPVKQAAIVTLADLVTMCRRLAKRKTGMALRDRALIAVGWAAAARSSELVALDWSDVQAAPLGLELTIRESKTDQEGHGEMVVLPLYREALQAACPVRALRELKIITGGDESTAVFPRCGFGADRSRLMFGTRANCVSVGRAVQRAARIAKLPGSFSSHSLRRGFATSAAGAGIPDRNIMQHGRWKSRAIMDGYVKRGQIWMSSALVMLTTDNLNPEPNENPVPTK